MIIGMVLVLCTNAGRSCDMGGGYSGRNECHFLFNLGAPTVWKTVVLTVGTIVGTILFLGVEHVGAFELKPANKWPRKRGLLRFRKLLLYPTELPERKLYLQLLVAFCPNCFVFGVLQH